MKIDAVITYVDMYEQVWLANYIKTFDCNLINACRYKPLGTIHLQIECIRRFMPWINNIYVVVSNKEQLQTNRAIVITHDQFIPEKYLPTFNSTTIEMFLYRIPGLADYFIYFNDDMFPIRPVDETAFFNGKPVCAFKRCKKDPLNKFRHHCKNGSNLARMLNGFEPAEDYIMPYHICTMQSKQAYEQVWEGADNVLDKSVSRVRTNKNFNQYLFADYMYFSGMCTLKKLDYTYIEYKDTTPEQLFNIVTKPEHDFLCVCDNVQEPDTYNRRLIQGLTDILSK